MGGHSSWVEHTGPDAVRLDLGRQGLGQSRQPELRGTVDTRIDPATLAGDGGDIDDRVPPGSPHVGEDRLGEDERRPQVHNENPIPVGDRQFLGLPQHGGAGGVDQNVDPPESSGGISRRQ